MNRGITSSHLHIQTQGEGQDVVLVHGWGLHGGIWDKVAEHLSACYCVVRVDLPGHGFSAPLAGGFTARSLADCLSEALADTLRGPAVWLGWSLGGLISLLVALRHRDLVRALILVGATPRFTTASARMRQRLARFLTSGEYALLFISPSALALIIL